MEWNAAVTTVGNVRKEDPVEHYKLNTIVILAVAFLFS